jgi:hypothetical protein
LISDRRIQSDTKNLANAYRIEVLELLSFGTDGRLSPRDQQMLRETVVQHLARRS